MIIESRLLIIAFDKPNMNIKSKYTGLASTHFTYLIHPAQWRRHLDYKLYRFFVKSKSPQRARW